jgi:hypothetical protein
MPKSEIELPKRVKDRRLVLDPKLRNSNIDKLDPKRTVPNIDIDDPNLMKDRTLILLPNVTVSRRERDEPKRAKPNNEKEGGRVRRSAQRKILLALSPMLASQRRPPSHVLLLDGSQGFPQVLSAKQPSPFVMSQS